MSHLELFKKYQTIEKRISSCGKVLGELKQKHQIVG